MSKEAQITLAKMRENEADAADAKEEADVKKKTWKNVKIERTDVKSIQLPTGMPADVALNWLQKAVQEENTVVRINHEIDCYPIEGAYALLKVLEREFGFAGMQATPGFFGETPPAFIGLELEPGKNVQVPWGRLVVPGIEGFLATGFVINPREKTARFQLKGEVRRKSDRKVEALVEMLKEEVRTASAFRGKAIEVQFPADWDEFNPAYVPKVLDVSGVNPAELVFPHDIQDMVDDNLFAPVEFTEAARAFKIPRKRGVCLEGPFGTGKTLTAFVLAKKCQENGWTFIYTKQTAQIDQAVALARQYQPAVVFVEDIDRVASGERDEAIDHILNTIDGIDSKTSEVMVVMTSNDIKAVTRALLRPGRLDAIIPVRAPDAEASERLLRLYGRGLIPANEDLFGVGVELAGSIPSVIREVVERSKLGAIRKLLPGDSLVIKAENLMVAARSMKAQQDLLNSEEPPELSDYEKGMGLIAKSIEGAAAALITAGKSNGNGHARKEDKKLLEESL